MKILILKKTILTIMVGVVIFFTTFLLNLGAVNVSSAYSVTNRKLPIYCVATNEKKIAITFDAAWSADDTDKLIEILNNHKVLFLKSVR